VDFVKEGALLEWMSKVFSSVESKLKHCAQFLSLSAGCSTTITSPGYRMECLAALGTSNTCEYFACSISKRTIRENVLENGIIYKEF
jgi:hypothetical protein